MPADLPVIKHSLARFLRDVQAGKVQRDPRNRVWREDRSSATGRRHAENPVRHGEAAHWIVKGDHGIYQLTAAGEQELAAYDQAVARVSRVEPVVTRTTNRRGQVA